MERSAVRTERQEKKTEGLFFYPPQVETDRHFMCSSRNETCNLNWSHFKSLQAKINHAMQVWAQTLILIGMAAGPMMDVWMGGKRETVSGFVFELMTAICRFYRLFSTLRFGIVPVSAAPRTHLHPSTPTTVNLTSMDFTPKLQSSYRHF